MFDSPQLRVALSAVREAAAVARQVQRELVTPALTKSDRSPVTVADFAVQALIARRLRDAFPADPLVGEEDASELRDPQQSATRDQVVRYVKGVFPQATADDVCNWIDLGGADPAPRFWTLDPIDGTKGFLRGDQYVVALALLVAGQVELGVIACPNLRAAAEPDMGGAGSVVVAAKGQGAWVGPLAGPLDARTDFVQLQVSEILAPAQARILRSFEAGHTNTDQLGQVIARFGATAEPVLMDSSAKYAVLAAGRGEAQFRLLSPSQPNYQEKIWDHAAGMLAVQEAGGRVTDLAGLPLDFTQGRSLAKNRGILATNGALHAAALAAVKATGA